MEFNNRLRVSLASPFIHPSVSRQNGDLISIKYLQDPEQTSRATTSPYAVVVRRRSKSIQLIIIFRFSDNIMVKPFHQVFNFILSPYEQLCQFVLIEKYG